MKKTKKFLSLMLALFSLLALTAVTLNFSTAKAGTIGNFTYEINDGEVTITGCVDPVGALTIPSTIDGYPVKEVGMYAFAEREEITSITIPDSVTSIGDGAFVACTGLTSITIGNSVTSIGSCAFSGCNGLTSITIPDSVTSIEDSAFSGCSGFKSITVSDKNTVYHSAGNCLIETESKTLITGCKNSVIPADGSVTSIGDSAFFYCAGLTSIEIPGSVTSIDWGAFYGCTGLTSITIGNSVTSIEDSAFYGCSGLESITVSSKNTVYHSAGNCLIETESKTLITGCKNSVIPADGSVTSIDWGAFSGCTGLTSITIPDSVTSINGSAFSDCTGLTSVKIGNGVTSIVYRAFSHCTGLKSIEIPGSVTSIGSSAFSHCTGLTSITIPDSVTSIGDYAFEECSGLTSVTIPASVTSIGEVAFSDGGDAGLFSDECLFKVYEDSYAEEWAETNGLNYIILQEKFTYEINDGEVTITDYPEDATGEVIIPSTIEGYPVTSIGEWAFSNCEGLTSITIPNSVTSIDGWAFHWCTGLTSITIPDSVTNIGEDAFSCCAGLESIKVSGKNTVYHSAGNCLIETKSKTLIVGCKNSVIPADGSVTSIGEWAFSYCEGLTSITIPGNIETIGSMAFDGCFSLSSIELCEGIKTIEQSAFSRCFALKIITIPASVTKIGIKVFDECSLETINVNPDNENYKSSGNCLIETSTKTLLWALNNSVIPNDGSIENIAYGAFSMCSERTSVVIPEGVKNVDSDTFGNCMALTSVTLPETLTNLSDFMFSNCRCLEEIIIPANVKKIGASVIIDIPNTVKLIFKGAMPSFDRLAFQGADVEILYPCTGSASNSWRNFDESYFSYYNSITLKKNHQLVKTSYNAATCTETGNYTYYTCSVCSKVFVDSAATKITTVAAQTIKAKGHNIVKVAAKAPTCSQYGTNEYYTCTRCHEVYTDSSASETSSVKAQRIEKAAHTLEKVPYKASTCTETGNYTYYKCTVCGKAFVDANGTKITTVAAQTIKTHKLVKTAYRAATCTKAGTNGYYTCRICGKVFTDSSATTETTIAAQRIDKLAHELEKVPYKASTCTETGNYTYYRCTVCDRVYVDANGTKITTVAAQTIKTHKLVKTAYRAATCTKAGTNGYYTCRICGKVFTDSSATIETTIAAQRIDKSAHELEKVAYKAATCTATGNYTYYKCSTCGKVFVDSAATHVTTVDAQTIAMKAHKIVYVSYKAPTATENGNKTHYECTHCGKLYKDSKGVTELTAADVTIKATGK